MSMAISNVSTFLLIDNALITDREGDAIPADERPGWVACIYDDKAASVSPHLIDLQLAYKVGHLDRAMALVNATPEKLHVSIIDTVLSCVELVQHLRHFIMVRCAGRKNLTLRFADCAVLLELAKFLAAEQWAALAWAMSRWQVHGYDGKLLALPHADAAVSPSSWPLVLTEQQLNALDTAMLPNKMLACLRSMRHGAALPGSVTEQNHWASESCRLWRDAGNTDHVVLRWLTSAVLDTHGEILRQKTIGTLLAQADLVVIRTGLSAAVMQHRAKLNRPREG